MLRSYLPIYLIFGSQLDTEKDIKRRKGLVLETMRTLNHIFKTHKLSILTKIRTFNAYCGSIFLYNSELWVTTKSVNNMIDSVHRRMLRKVLDIKWPEVINNNELYDTTKEEKWSYIIKGRRLSWLGHLMRLDTPARKAHI